MLPISEKLDKALQIINSAKIDRALRIADSASVRGLLTSVLSRHDKEFVESEHPRDGDGKFAPYASGSPMNAELKKAGFTKGASSGQGKMKFEKNGNTLVVEPPKGQHSKSVSQVWSLYSGAKGFGGKQIASGVGPMKLAKALGGLGPEEGKVWKPEKHEAMTLHGNPNFAAAMNSAAEHEAAKVAEAAQAAIKAAAPASPAATMPTQATEPNAAHGLDAKQVTSNTATKAGFTFLETTPSGITTFQKGDSSIGVAPNGDWVSFHPGSYPKEGQGAASLEMLMSGKMPSNPPWKNIPGQGIYQSPSQKAAAEAQQKEYAEKQAAAQKALAEKYAQPPSAYTEPAHIIQSLAKHNPPNPPKSAISAYCGSGYMTMNTKMRHGEGGSHYDAEITKLKSYLDKAALPEDMTVFRGVNGDYSKILKSLLYEGASFMDKGFVSTSASKDFSKKWAGSSHGNMLFEIKVKKGAKGAAVSAIAGNLSEHEILFQSNSKFKVLKFDEAKNFAVLELFE